MPAAEPVAAEARIAAVVLAAGTSSRLGSDLLKQLLAPDGEALAHRTCRLALESGLEPVLVVLGHRAAEVAASLGDLEVERVMNPDYTAGQSTSVRRGLEALPEAALGVLFLPCDQPYLDQATIEALIAAFHGQGDRAREHIFVPCSGKQRGAPVLFGAALRPELEQLSGDQGGRRILKLRPELVVEVELPSARPLFDIDTLDDLERARSSG